MMTSLALVLVIKGLVSPHSPPTAYIAVTFQAVTGALIFRYMPGLLFGSIFFFTLGLIESAMQRMLTLTILYGITLWKAIDTWGEYVTKQWGVLLPLSSSGLIILIYLAIHLIFGIGVGWFTYKIIRAVNKHWGENKYKLYLGAEDNREFINRKSTGSKILRRWVLFFMLAIVIALAYYLPDHDHDIRSGLISIIRALAILVVWFVFLAPLFIRLLKNWLNKKHKELANEIASTMDMFPQLLWIIDKAWKETAALHFLKRLKLFLLHTFLYILQYQTRYDTDPDRSGEES